MLIIRLIIIIAEWAIVPQTSVQCEHWEWLPEAALEQHNGRQRVP